MGEYFLSTLVVLVTLSMALLLVRRLPRGHPQLYESPSRELGDSFMGPGGSSGDFPGYVQGNQRSPFPISSLPKGNVLRTASLFPTVCGALTLVKMKVTVSVSI